MDLEEKLCMMSPPQLSLKKKTDRQKKTSLRKKESASKSSIPEYARGRDASVR